MYVVQLLKSEYTTKKYWDYIVSYGNWLINKAGFFQYLPHPT